ncbi:MAG: glycerol-3-phosphate 1-O-acyltransferase PlsY [Bacteroidetes bacterium]|jgi:glycerol-3-phosphate acyltransferase PlsY|nr:glycerol-3-phosphate 1-O-acyltransferase PlsY [Bacteroidota bacterium]HQW46045.1 glycerol-3-phosphate 1-O-acyltransferase PlsY [Chitinophagaceae bacterium]MBK6819630.1 glycerol-3-phosphate 1-O-acyltransferase PlsY [Bacteroidota bacterium]MBK7039482.1 glycerol-3-phosphate 1-O-acyltransferase PlsY [Bacteroidota bacterium]MBK7589103.1 glycerol-3-phosphate 1-O-acyltransferase PlsY [Bacteroidota bacterium]
MYEFILILLAYLLGSIPTAVWVSKYFFDIDIRSYGSGNAGATNTFRVLGAKAGSFVFIVDMLKGFLAVDLAYFIAKYQMDSVALTNFQVLLGIAAVVGHVFPIWANFKGGKGIATLFGMILAIQPLVAVCLIVVFMLMLFMTRYVSLSSITASIAFPVMIFFIFREPEIMYRLFALATAILVVLTHHKNINRLLSGSESKVPLFKKKDKQ